MFQLKERLRRTHHTQPLAKQPSMQLVSTEADEEYGDEGEEGEEEEMVQEPDQSNQCLQKPESGLRRITARFGRRRTHNEQLCVSSCGIILGRATFYGAEGPNSVRVRVYISFSFSH